MASIQDALLSVGRLDRLASLDTPVHHLDPRAKLIATLLYVVAVVSMGKYEISSLLPYALFPAVMIPLGRLPAGYLGRKLLWALPFVLFVGIFNPLLDRAPLLQLGPVTVSGGWVSFASILIRSLLTVGAALILVATTGMPGVCAGIERLGAPRIFAVQLLFLYRYLFVLGEEALRMARARALRSFGRRGMSLRVAASMLGHLLLRTLDRAERVHTAMLARGFTGEVRLAQPMRFRLTDTLFVAGCGGAFAALRFVNLSRLLGGLVTGGAG